jgi:hypothetical protein
MKTALLACAAVLALGGSAHAARFSTVDGNKLLQICTNPKLSTSCTAYIEGISDSISLYQELRPQDGSKGGALPAYVCVPEQVTGLRERDTVVSFLKQHPESASRPAAGVVADALRSAYACQ